MVWSHWVAWPAVYTCWLRPHVAVPPEIQHVVGSENGCSPQLMHNQPTSTKKNWCFGIPVSRNTMIMDLPAILYWLLQNPMVYPHVPHENCHFMHISSYFRIFPLNDPLVLWRHAMENSPMNWWLMIMYPLRMLIAHGKPLKNQMAPTISANLSAASTQPCLLWEFDRS